MSNPILREFPDSFDTERLYIRAPRAGDGPAYNAAVLESLEDLKPWLPWAHETPSVEDSEATLRRKAAEFLVRADLMLLLWRKADGMLVGGSGLHRIDWAVPCLEIGYWQRTCMTGNGYMTEAVRGVTRFAFEQIGAQRVEIRVDSLNRRSIAVAERAGYTLEATLRHQARGTDGSLRDTLLYVRFPTG